MDEVRRQMADDAEKDPDIEETDGEDGAEGEEDGGKGKKKLIIIAAAALVLLLVGGGAAYFLLFSGGGEGDEDIIAVTETYFYDLPEMTVNLNSEAGSEQFLKLSVSLEVADAAMVEAIEPRVARVIDAFQVYLRELRQSDLEGSAGIYRLKEELRRRVNLALYPVQVDRILFKQILVQ